MSQHYFYPAASFSHKPNVKYTIGGDIVESEKADVDQLLAARPTIPVESQVVSVQTSDLPKGSSPDVDSQPAQVAYGKQVSIPVQSSSTVQISTPGVSSVRNPTEEYEQPAVGTSSPAASLVGSGTGVSNTPINVVDTITPKFETASVPSNTQYPFSSNIV